MYSIKNIQPIHVIIITLLLTGGILLGHVIDQLGDTTDVAIPLWEPLFLIAGGISFFAYSPKKKK